FFFFQAEDGIRDLTVTGVQTCALPILSERALVFEEEPLARRHLYMAEASGLDEESLAAVLVRSLLTEGQLRYPVVQKDENGVMRTHTIVREGPTGLLLTTANLQVDEQLQ